MRAFVLGLLLLAPACLRAQETVVQLDPATSTVTFTLSATLHTVHGAFKLKSGEIRLDPATGKASGEIVVDATSGNSENSSRDHNMHAQVLESAKFPEIIFSPTQITAAAGRTLKQGLETPGTTQIGAEGKFRLHGEDHDVTLSLTLKNDGDGRLEIDGPLQVPYVKWGLKNPSTFILRVGESADVELHASGRIVSGH